MPVPEIIHQLVKRFDDNSDAYRSFRYNEAQLRQEFLNPFFEALGWDISNKKGYSIKYREVIHEDTLRVQGSAHAKSPDYAFRLGGVRKFFVEAKKPAEDINNNRQLAYQLKVYAWNAHLPLSIITDFEDFAVYDCRNKPNPNDSPGTARVMLINFREYSKKWDEIAEIFSPEAIKIGAFDQYVMDNAAKKGTVEVDDAFLSDIENWRTLLARNIALRNLQITNEKQLNFAVQMTIDRIIFLRICEDRGIEPENQLLEMCETPDIYKNLLSLFFKADIKYNSGLFHFREEKGATNRVDTFTPTLSIDNRVLKEVIKSLYYPCPYIFKEIPVEILGQVYEQFLGKVIRLTPGRRVMVEEKPEVRKAGGVYYTPRYIVDYIVKNTVGKLLQGKTPNDADNMKIVDPACGSGSFLLGAYQFLLNWHFDWYTQNEPEKWAKGKSPALAPAEDGNWLLTTDEKKRILVNNIFGVDIDPQAVEVTKLSLLMKVLEEETGQLSFGFERVLPDLGDNIKCGNSLIGQDYFESQLIPDENEKYRINPFSWERAFPTIFAKGGFDVVIGNPPYVRQETLGSDKDYFKKKYQVYAGTADLYSYFIEKGISLLVRGGMFSYIVANKWLRANYGKPLRDWLKTKCIEEITDFGDLPVFEGATTYPSILRVANKQPHMKPRITSVKDLDFVSLSAYVDEHGDLVDQTKFEDAGWTLSDSKTQQVLEKLKKNTIALDRYVNGKIFYGIKTALNEAFVITEEKKNEIIQEDPKSKELIKPFAIGREIKRYQPIENKQYLIFIPKGWTNSKTTKHAWGWFESEYPAIAKHLSQFEQSAKKRQDKGDYWWELRGCDYYDEFEKLKIVYPNICKRPEYTFDSSGLYTNQKCFIIGIYSPYLLGILNSKMTDFLYSKILPKLRGDFYEPGFSYMKNFPIRIIDFASSQDSEWHYKLEKLVEHMLALHMQNPFTPDDKQRLGREIDETDKKIDRLVYELYDLTEDEISIIEKETNNRG
jgi:hypothetical protein